MSPWPAAALFLAYVLPGPVLLRQFGDRRLQAPGSTHLEGTISFFGQDARSLAAKAGAPLQGVRADRVDFPARLSFSPGRCALSFGLPDRPLGRIVDEGGKITENGPAPVGATLLAAEGCLPFLWRGAEAASAWMALLQSRGVNPRRVDLTRFDGRVAYAIGGAAGGPMTLVLSEERLLPLRLLVHDGPSLLDVRLREYRPAIPEGALPGRWSIFRDGAKVVSFNVEPVTR